MAEYQKFLNDFPHRCEKILKAFESGAEMEGVEVTLMLSVASAAFVVAFESIRDENSLTDERQQLSTEAIGNFEKLLDEGFLGSRIEVRGNWELVRQHRDTNPPWPNHTLNGDHKLPTKASVFYILDLLRNSIGHGNIQTFSGDGKNIDLLVFIVWAREHMNKTPIRNSAIDKCKPRKYDMLAVSPSDLKEFLIGWLNYLKELDATSKELEMSN